MAAVECCLPRTVAEEVLRRYADVVRVGKLQFNGQFITWDTNTSTEHQLNNFCRSFVHRLCELSPELKNVDPDVIRLSAYWYCKAVSFNYSLIEVLTLVKQLSGCLCTIETRSANEGPLVSYIADVCKEGLLRASLTWHKSDNIIYCNPEKGTKHIRGTLTCLETEFFLPPPHGYVPSYHVQLQLKRSTLSIVRSLLTCKSTKKVYAAKTFLVEQPLRSDHTLETFRKIVERREDHMSSALAVAQNALPSQSSNKVYPNAAQAAGTNNSRSSETNWETIGRLRVRVLLASGLPLHAVEHTLNKSPSSTSVREKRRVRKFYFTICSLGSKTLITSASEAIGASVSWEAKDLWFPLKNDDLLRELHIRLAWQEGPMAATEAHLEQDGIGEYDSSLLADGRQSLIAAFGVDDTKTTRVVVRLVATTRPMCDEAVARSSGDAANHGNIGGGLEILLELELVGVSAESYKTDNGLARGENNSPEVVSEPPTSVECSAPEMSPPGKFGSVRGRGVVLPSLTPRPLRARTSISQIDTENDPLLSHACHSSRSTSICSPLALPDASVASDLAAMEATKSGPSGEGAYRSSSDGAKNGADCTRGPCLRKASLHARTVASLGDASFDGMNTLEGPSAPAAASPPKFGPRGLGRGVVSCAPALPNSLRAAGLQNGSGDDLCMSPSLSLPLSKTASRPRRLTGGSEDGIGAAAHAVELRTAETVPSLQVYARPSWEPPRGAKGLWCSSSDCD